MKREQIIHALYTQKVIGNIDLMELLEKAGYKDCSISAIIDRITDAILALPLDVPSDEELYEWAGYCAGNTTENHDKRIVYQAALVLGAKWMKNGIIKRNTKK